MIIKKNGAAEYGKQSAANINGVYKRVLINSIYSSWGYVAVMKSILQGNPEA